MGDSCLRCSGCILCTDETDMWSSAVYQMGSGIRVGREVRMLWPT